VLPGCEFPCSSRRSAYSCLSSSARIRTRSPTLNFVSSITDHRPPELGDVTSHKLDGALPSGVTGSPSVDRAVSPSRPGTLYKAFWSCKLILFRTLLAERSSSISPSLRSCTFKEDSTAGTVSIMVSFEQVGGYCNARTIAPVFPADLTLNPTLGAGPLLQHHERGCPTIRVFEAWAPRTSTPGSLVTYKQTNSMVPIPNA
jgi:hypothetical protein